jgi:DNA-3-methyladenine glycosylase II
MPSKRKPKSPHAKAERHLSQSHERMREIIERVGPCTLATNPNHFHALVRTIIAQQLSTTVAKTIGQRLELALAPDGATPKRIQELSDEVIRGCGLSGAKLKSLRDLSARILDGSLVLEGIAERSDDEIREALLRVHGIGPWSVDMFLIFSVGHADVLPVGDLGLRVGMRDLFGLTEVPSPKELFEMAEPWRPYRSIATWYFWRSKGPVPQS